jgi:hypothetical protein
MWNHYLIGLGKVTLPAWATTAKDTIIPVSDRGKYAWIKSIGELPL